MYKYPSVTYVTAVKLALSKSGAKLAMKDITTMHQLYRKKLTAEQCAEALLNHAKPA